MLLSSVQGAVQPRVSSERCWKTTEVKDGKERKKERKEGRKEKQSFPFCVSGAVEVLMVINQSDTREGGEGCGLWLWSRIFQKPLK